MSADVKCAGHEGQRTESRALPALRDQVTIRRDWLGKSFDGKCFFEHKFNGLSIVDCNLSECMFFNCVFQDCDFRDVCFAFSSFQNCEFINVSGTSNDWTHTSFYNSCICPKTSFYFSTWGLLKLHQEQPGIKVKINPYFGKIKGEMINVSSQNQRVRG